MIGAGRPPTDEQISQICACQLVSTRLAQAAPNGGSLRERAKTQVALRDGLPVSLRPRQAEVPAAD